MFTADIFREMGTEKDRIRDESLHWDFKRHCTIKRMQYSATRVAL